MGSIWARNWAGEPEAMTQKSGVRVPSMRARSATSSGAAQTVTLWG